MSLDLLDCAFKIVVEIRIIKMNKAILGIVLFLKNKNTININFEPNKIDAIKKQVHGTHFFLQFN